MNCSQSDIQQICGTKDGNQQCRISHKATTATGYCSSMIGDRLNCHSAIMSNMLSAIGIFSRRLFAVFALVAVFANVSNAGEVPDVGDAVIQQHFATRAE